MRLHHLQVEAFGPFAGSARVDFDALGDAGLFLLSGATGAGKTSVLDAVCFALYGDVPGDRAAAKRLRSDQAAPDAPTRVTLEATLGGRRFRFVRSPAWQRPKKRGTGVTTQPAAVTVSERRGQEWTPLTSRADEAGDLVGRVVGLTLTQFTQVAMLPQGRFQAFLRATSDDRHRLLTQLFRTGRFERVEQWLREHRLRLARQHDVVHERVADLTSRFSEAAGQALPDAVDVHHLGPAADDHSLRSWVDEQTSTATGRQQDAQTVAAAAGERETAARADLDAARDLAARLARLDAAHAELRQLQLAAADHRAAVRRLDAARRAAGVLPLHRLAGSAVATAERAEHRAAAALAAARDQRGQPVPPTELAAVAEAAGVAAVEARAAVPRARRLADARAELADTDAECARAAARRDEARDRQLALPGLVTAATAALDRSRAALAEQPALRELVTVLTARSEALTQLAALRPEVEAARGASVAATEHRLALAEVLVTVQQERLDGMAAELAGALAVGASCPVCGSGEHPHKAVPMPGSPDANTERDARRAVDDASAVEHAHADTLRSLESQLTALEAQAGDADATAVADQLGTTFAQLVTAEAESARIPELTGDLDRLDEQRDRFGHLVADAEAALARAETARVALADEVAALEREIAAHLEGTGHERLEHLAEMLDRVAAGCRDALAAAADAQSATTHAAEADRAVADAVSAAGFAGIAEALAAALPGPEVEVLAEQVAHHDRRLAAVQRELDGLDPAALAQARPPDLAALTAGHDAAREALREADADLRRWAGRAERLTGLRDALLAELEAWRPLRADLALATRLASFVEGKSPDNQLRMRLSAYVLAYRLSQVVDAANERLARMSDRRYSLEHTGHRGAGETRGGLSLLVRDDWSGETRDPATLSGGETFVVSLALALGLADVIAHEAGGATLETLFVDEGFGSLDAETLDDVMDTLDSLRDGGRVVGVVSHVAEMRDRIPTQLVVTKARTGSTLAVIGG